MKVAIALVIGLLGMSPFAIIALDAFGVGPAFEASAPDWAPGYEWTWDVTGRGRAAGEGMGVVRFESEDLRIDATRRAAVLNTTTEHEGTPLDIVLETFRIDRVRYGGETVYDSTDAEGEQYDTDAGFADEFFCLTPCGTFLAPYTKDGNPYVAPAFAPLGADEAKLFDFPLTRGKTWTLMDLHDDTMRFEIEATAAGVEYVDLDGFAPMQAVRIEARLTEASKTAIGSLIKQEAAKEGIDLDLDFDLKATYWYAPEVQNLIKFDLDGFFAARATGYGAAGSGRVDFHLDQVLDAYKLVATREHPIEDAYALQEAAWAGEDVGAEASPIEWDFAVGAEALSVDVTEDVHALRFGLVEAKRAADADDAPVTTHDAAPDGSRVTWTHRYSSADGGEHLERATGDTAAFDIGTPGLHVVSAQVFDSAGRVIGADQVVIEAYTIHTWELPGPVGGFVGANDAVMEIPLAQGASTATTQIDPQGTVRGTLVIAGPNGQEAIPVDATLDPVTVTFEDLTAGARSLHWEDDARVGDLTLITEIRYDRSVPPAAPAEGRDAMPSLFDLLESWF